MVPEPAFGQSDRCGGTRCQARRGWGAVSSAPFPDCCLIPLCSHSSKFWPHPTPCLEELARHWERSEGVAGSLEAQQQQVRAVEGRGQRFLFAAAWVNVGRQEGIWRRCPPYAVPWRIWDVAAVGKTEQEGRKRQEEVKVERRGRYSNGHIHCTHWVPPMLRPALGGSTVENLLCSCLSGSVIISETNNTLAKFQIKWTFLSIPNLLLSNIINSGLPIRNSRHVLRDPQAQRPLELIGSLHPS